MDPAGEAARTGRRRGVLFPLLILGGLLHAGQPALAANLAAVMSQDLLPYREAVEGISEQTGEPVEVYDLKADPDGEDGVLRSLQAAGPKVVFAIGARAAQVLARRLPGVPIVFCMVLGLDLDRLEGPMVTGVALEVPAGEQISAFRAVVPSLSRIAVLFDPGKSQALMQQARAAARRQGIALLTRSVSRPDEVPSAFREVVRQADGLWLLPDSTVVSRESFDFILKQSVERRIPVMVFSEPMVVAGGLLCLTAGNREIGRQAGRMGLQILRQSGGPLPPVETPRRTRTILNLKTAGALGLTVPSAAIRSASQVIR